VNSVGVDCMGGRMREVEDSPSEEVGVRKGARLTRCWAAVG
jgi:hypothetical protein